MWHQTWVPTEPVRFHVGYARDVLGYYTAKRCSNRPRKIPGIAFAELLYVDDTLLILRNKETLDKFLHDIEVDSEYYGLRLNRGNCELLDMNGKQDLEFLNGEHMQHVEKATNIGGILMKKKLTFLLRFKRGSQRQRQSSTRWVRSEKRRIIAWRGSLWFLSGCYQQIILWVRKPDRYRNSFAQIRHVSNEKGYVKLWVFRQLSLTEATRMSQSDKKDELELEVQPLTEFLKNIRLKLLGHVIRAAKDDPLKEVMLNRGTMEIKTVGFRRVGRPKTHWIHTVMNGASQIISTEYPDEIHEYDDIFSKSEL